MAAQGHWLVLVSSSSESEGSSREATQRELSAVCSSDHILRFPFRVYWLSSSSLFFSLSLARSGAETAQTVQPQVPENHKMHKMVKHKNRNHSQPASVPSCSWFGKMLHGCSQTQGPSVKLPQVFLLRLSCQPANLDQNCRLDVVACSYLTDQ